MNRVAKAILNVSVLGTTAITLSGCGAMGTYIHHRNIESQSKMSESVFLDPVSSKAKTIFVQVRNTSGQDFSKFRPDLVEDLQSKGWTVVDDVSQPHHAMVQVNLLQFGKAQSEAAVWASLGNGFGSALTGGLAGVAVAMMTNSAAIGVGAGAGVGGVSWLASEMYSNVLYSAMTDVQVSIRSDNGKVTQVTNSHLTQGTQSHVTQEYKQESNWVRYRTRVASVVQKANLDAEEAMPTLAKQQAAEIAGIFV